MSAAFDTIDRATLLNILETIIEEDELRLVRFLLSNTCLNIRIGGTKEEKKFTSNIGTPQGDSLSPILFVVYLENALKEVRMILPESEKTLPNEIAYADDVDFIAQERIDVAQIQRVLKRYNLEVNVDKTEYTILDRNEKSWKNTKKVGTLIGDTGDVQRRNQLSTAALAKLQNVWVRDGVCSDKYRGRPITTLPVVLNNDLSRLESNTYGLKTFEDIENLKKIAEQRDQWRILCTRIQKATEALQSDDYDAERR
ncbi:hypothetical protein RRG08_056718 [Elysia crispata]|uniref:Reverse transcriptase domain-containing protein n=1 Tax=Elysia crispata TaxID=231223 RepID=A0AAE1CZI2_9GAST|nr:hypothetical protein RRG08_056718 [Elysia crispata]